MSTSEHAIAVATSAHKMQMCELIVMPALEALLSDTFWR